uniref:asparaginase n=2 Tax=Cacopsylla melanoneura TaxID=428564 RepID=A0A8D8Q1S4_9HEMI
MDGSEHCELRVSTENPEEKDFSSNSLQNGFWRSFERQPDPEELPIKQYSDRKASLSLSSPEERLESKVLVVYTGGTIGMEYNEQGVLAPSRKPLNDKIRENPLLHDKHYDVKTEEDDILVLPRVKDKKRVLYKVVEYTPLLDSSNMCQADWVKMSNHVKEYYEKFDGFVILHGTDTLSYTASALSFMLENLGKPVVVTGSQISIFQITSDGVYNFLGALIFAGNYDIPEVTVYFNNKLSRGNRTIKMSVTEFDAFDSPNCPLLGKVGLTIDINMKSVHRPSQIKKFSVHNELCQNVGLLRIYPDISKQTIRSFIQHPMEGIVLLTYGSGNFPTNRSDLIEELKLACDRDVIIVSCSQCSRGGTSATYETGKILTNIGIINGYDMTPEAALTKLLYVLSKSELTLKQKKDMMTTNIRGELSTNLEHRDEDDLASTVAKSLQISGVQEVNKLKKILYPAMLQSAVREGNVDKIKDMQKYGADLSMTDFDGRNILHTACSSGKLNIVQYCLENGVSVHTRDNYNISPLHEAIIADQHDIIKLLRKCGAHLTNESMFLGDVLTNAAARGMVRRLQSYLLAGVSLNQTDSIGLTPLHAAITTNELECVKFLLLQQVDVNIKNKFGQTALNLGNQVQNNEINNLLLAFSETSKK